ncbi:carnitine dehydratase [Thauera sinica]|nr:carnitine dehydratase [Thauera sp. K11]
MTVVELAGLGPAPFCGMLLSDMGARVIRVDRPPAGTGNGLQDISDGPVNRGRESISIDLRHESGIGVLMRLVRRADVLIEGFRPGVAEKLGFGPEACRRINPALIFARMTGWGQTGPLASAAGHDINYIGLSGALHAMGDADRAPAPPLNLVGDYGGGGMLLAYGIVCALLEARSSGRGQVLDAAMTDGAALLMSPIYAMLGADHWRNERQANFLDGAAPFYCTYRCADGRFMAVGAIEPPFYRQFLGLLEIGCVSPSDQWRKDTWQDTRTRIAGRFMEKTRDEWAAVFDGSDACCTPVLDMIEAPQHPHNAARSTFTRMHGMSVPSPAPRLSRTPPGMAGGVPRIGEHTQPILEGHGFSPAEIDALHAGKVVFMRHPAAGPR